MIAHDGAWFARHLDVAKGNPPKDFHANCPVCGSRDNVHITDKPDGAEVFCFGCQANTAAVIEALASPESETPIIRRVKRDRPEPRDASAERDPLAWWAEHCGVPRSFLSYLPIAADGGDVAFMFDGLRVTKRRRAGTKTFAWEPTGTAKPPMWPVPMKVMPAAMILTEGEADATVMAYHVTQSTLDGMLAVHTVPNGAANEVSVGVWRELARRGLQQVLVLFDEDKAGDEGAEANIATASAAGLYTRRVHIEDLDLLLGEKDARDVWLRKTADDPAAVAELNLTERSLSDLGAHVLTEVDGSAPPELVLGVIDPEGHTIIYGQGDAGKGVIAAYLIAGLTRAGERVLIADFEGHPNEWRRRVAAHGGKTDLVAIYEPTRAVWDEADAIGDIGRDFGAKYLFIDSITMAAAGEKDPYSPNVPAKYGAAIRRTGLVTLSLAHCGRSDILDYPFGSIGWHQQARTTWSLDASGATRIFEHRKKGNRPWQGKFDASITFDDENNAITTVLTREDGAMPTVRRVTKEERANDLRALVTSAISRIERPEDAITASALAEALHRSKPNVLATVKEVAAKGEIGVTENGRYWRGSAVPDGSGTDRTAELDRPEGAGSRESASDPGHGSDGSTPREPEPEPSVERAPRTRGQRE